MFFLSAPPPPQHTLPGWRYNKNAHNQQVNFSQQDWLDFYVLCQEGQITFWCPMRFDNFPLDIQICKFKVRLVNQSYLSRSVGPSNMYIYGHVHIANICINVLVIMYVHVSDNIYVCINVCIYIACMYMYMNFCYLFLSFQGWQLCLRRQQNAIRCQPALI